jgi:threonylcarbamoyladenosine tRNA methylthiotransferase MtaB
LASQLSADHLAKLGIMATFSIENFGCRATQADAAAIERHLLNKGYGYDRKRENADVVVLNTCTVTAAADAQAREAIRDIHRTNPAARIIVTGCYAQRAPEELAALDGVTLVVGNSHQAEIPGLVEEMVSPGRPAAQVACDLFPLARLDPQPFSLARGPAKILTGNIFEASTVPFGDVEGNEGERTRPILKIQDGCNNRCSYCVIPFVRGRSRSLPPDTVLAEVDRLVRCAAREIVLSGINLGSYGRDLGPGVELQGVVRRILEETTLERLRFSSIEPMDVTQDFIELVAFSERIAPHFHIPLQSGSDRILRAMHRWYRTEHYARRVELIRERLPDAAIGADVIAGFPGETEKDFEATLDFINALPFTYLHVFSFSRRPGTRAEKLEGELPHPVIRERARRLRSLAAGKSAVFRASQAGRVLRALMLHRSGDGWTEALTGNYLKVRVAGKWPANLWFDVRLTADAQEPVVSIPASSRV